jgi:hypothetical protein
MFDPMKEPSTDFPLEDVEALPEILGALNKSGRIDIVTDWLAKHGVTHGEADFPSVDAIRIALDLVLKAPAGKSRLCAECVALALGLYREEGRNISDIARAWGISRQSAQAMTARICIALGVPIVETGKSIAARETYQETNFRHQKAA